MWTSTDITTYKKEFDFSSSEQGKQTFTALKVGDVEFINMIEGIEGDLGEDQMFQSIICDHCGIYRCSYGNWLAIRSIKDFVFFIPAFDNIADDPSSREYEPPYYLNRDGALYTSMSDFKRMAELVPAFQKVKSLKKLNKFELISLYKWDSPLKIFGNFPNFSPIKTDQILAVSELDNDEIALIIMNKLDDLKNAKHYSLEPIVNEEIICVYLYDVKTTEWKALCKTVQGYELVIGDKFKVTVN
ncbi:MAG: hypothetical protein ACI81Y_002832 [Glaciecola sp.]|jgi:hypothetical protein